MTREEAAKILDPETREEVLCEYEYYGGFHGREAVISAVDEACVVAVEALHAQQTVKGVEIDPVKTVKLDRSQWEGCETCKNQFAQYRIKPCANGDLAARATFMCDGYGPGVVLFVDRNTASGYFDISYCPHCGRPLTEEAWAELERRIGGNDGTTDRKK